MTWVSEQTKKDVLELAKSSDINQDGGFAIYKGKQYYVNVEKGIVDPVIQHGELMDIDIDGDIVTTVDNRFEAQKKYYINVLEVFFGGK